MRWAEQATDHVPLNGKWACLCEGVHQVECKLPTRDSTLLNVVIDPGACIPEHHHETQHETIFVVEGCIRDENTGEMTTEGSVYNIPAQQQHTIMAGSNGALLNVLFRPKFQ